MQKIRQGFDRFLDSGWFMLLVAAIVVLAWSLQWEIAGPVLLVATACMILLLREDLTPILVPVSLVAFSYFFEASPDNLLGLPSVATRTYVVAVAAGAGAVLVCLLLYLYRYFIRAKRKPDFGALWQGMAAAAVVSVLSGVLNPAYDKADMLPIAGVCLMVFLLYFVIVNCTRRDLRRFACRIMMFAGFVIVAELLVCFSQIDDLSHVLAYKMIRVGWGTMNGMATFLIMAITAALYLGIGDRNNWAYVLSAFIFGLMLLITMSRGNLLFGAVIIPVAYIFALIRTPYKKSMLAATGCLFVLLAVFVICFRSEIVELFSHMFSYGVDDNGRFPLWEQAWQRFLDNPVFGCGFTGDDGGQYPGNLWCVHSTPLQILSSTGVVGVLGFSVFYYQRYRTLLKKISVFKFFAFLVVAAYELYGLLDMSLFMLDQILFVFLFVGAAEKETEEMRQPFRGAAPYHRKINKGV